MTSLGQTRRTVTSSLRNVAISQTETRIASSLLLGRVQSAPLTSQIQSLTLVPRCEGCGWRDGKGKAGRTGPWYLAHPVTAKHGLRSRNPTSWVQDQGGTTEGDGAWWLLTGDMPAEGAERKADQGWASAWAPHPAPGSPGGQREVCWAEYHLPSWPPFLYLVSLSPSFFHIDSFWPWGDFSSSSSVSMWH